MTNIFKSQKEPLALVLYELVNLIGCKITYASLRKRVLQHPAFPSLFCITNTLTNFGIENKAVRIKSEQLLQLQTPFLATTYTDETVLVRKLEDGMVDYFSPSLGWQKKKLSKFIGQWSQMAILVATETNVEEDMYVIKKKQETLQKLRLPIGISYVAILVIALAFNLGAGLTLSYFFIKILGLAVAILLVNKEINKGAKYSFCNMGSKLSCDDVLNSPAAKILPWLSMTDLSLLYFTGTVLITTVSSLVPSTLATWLLELSIILGFLSLPYTLFSVVYQGLVIKKWCLLCLVTVAVLWLESIIGYSLWRTLDFGFDFQLKGITLFCICLLLPAILWMFLKNIFLKSADFDYHRFAHLRMMNNVDIFELFQRQRKEIPMNWKNDEIVLGNPNAQNQLVIAVNPFCPACRMEYLSVLQLLERYPQYANVNIRFVGNFNELDRREPYASAMLIDHYLIDPSGFTKLLKDWFESRNLKDFAKVHPVVHTKKSEEIVGYHYAWSENVGIEITPTSYLNGKKLWERYHLEQLIRMLDMTPKF